MNSSLAPYTEILKELQDRNRKVVSTTSDNLCNDGEITSEEEFQPTWRIKSRLLYFRIRVMMKINFVIVISCFYLFYTMSLLLLLVFEYTFCCIFYFLYFIIKLNYFLFYYKKYTRFQYSTVRINRVYTRDACTAIFYIYLLIFIHVCLSVSFIQNNGYKRY